MYDEKILTKDNVFMVGIYKITNKINGKAYIGQSTNIKRRWNVHKNASVNPNGKCYEYPLYRAMRKYGLDNFTFEVVEECKKSELNEREIFYIQKYNTYADGYNQDNGGECARHYHKLSDDLVLKIIQRLKTSDDHGSVIGAEFGVSYWTIRDINSGKTCRQESESYPIRPPLNPVKHRTETKPYTRGFNSPEIDNEEFFCEICGAKITRGAKYCTKCSQLSQRRAKRPEPLELARMVKENGFSAVGRQFGVDGNTIKKWCEQYGLPRCINKLIAWYNEQMGIVEYIKTRAISGKSKPVIQIDISTNRVINIFNSLKDAGISLGLSRYDKIGEVCNGHGKTAYGFKWEYLNEDDGRTKDSDSLIQNYQEKFNIQPVDPAPVVDDRKAVYQIDSLTDEIVAKFESINAAARAFGKKKGTHIGEACNGIIELAYGYKWEFANKDKTSKLDTGPKAVFQIDIKTNEIIAKYDNLKEAARSLNIENASSTSISRVCKHRQQAAYGFKWCYADEYTPSTQPSSLPTAI
jgi:group I intron endonuclease